MSQSGRVAWWIVGVTLVLQLLEGCAGGAPLVAGPARVVRATLSLDGVPIAANWTLPPEEATALVVLEHGYAQHCASMAPTAQRMAGAGLLVLCLEVRMANGNPVLAQRVAALLLDDGVAPAGLVLPRRIIVAGHSAGASFAAHLGARVDALAPDRLAGALLFDPVATEDLGADLRRISSAGMRPVLAITAPPSSCNASHSAYAALREVRRDAFAAGRDGFVGVELAPGATHTDIEGDDADWIATVACGHPLPANTERVRALAVQWAQAMAAGTPPVRSIPPTERIIE